MDTHAYIYISTYFCLTRLLVVPLFYANHFLTYPKRYWYEYWVIHILSHTMHALLQTTSHPPQTALSFGSGILFCVKYWYEYSPTHSHIMHALLYPQTVLTALAVVFWSVVERWDHSWLSSSTKHLSLLSFSEKYISSLTKHLSVTADSCTRCRDSNCWQLYKSWGQLPLTCWLGLHHLPHPPPPLPPVECWGPAPSASRNTLLLCLLQNQQLLPFRCHHFFFLWCIKLQKF